MHHGIKGQKWGQKNGPPYPLKAGSHSSGEKTEQGRGFANKVLSKFSNKKVNQTAGIAAETVTALAYIGFFASLFAAQEISYQHDKKKNRESNTSDIQKRIKGKHTPEQDLKAVNPDYDDPTDMGARVNCTMCSTAYELRRRGYDVEAQKTMKGRRPADVAKWYNMSKKDIKNYNTRSQFEKALQKEPDGSRGLTFTSYGLFNSYHCMIWEKKDGNIWISDGQNNTPPKSVKESGISANGAHPYSYIRTDNADINWDAIRDAVKERKED